MIHQLPLPDRLQSFRGSAGKSDFPKAIRVDQGTEFVSRDLDL
jgi:hypothetical protein